MSVFYLTVDGIKVLVVWYERNATVFAKHYSINKLIEIVQLTRNEVVDFETIYGGIKVFFQNEIQRRNSNEIRLY